MARTLSRWLGGMTEGMTEVVRARDRLPGWSVIKDDARSTRLPPRDTRAINPDLLSIGAALGFRRLHDRFG